MLLNDALMQISPARRARPGTSARTPMSIVAAACLAIAAPLAQGCVTNGPDGAGSVDDEPTGQLVMPLLQAGTLGELFHLANAIFDVTTPSGALITVDGSGNQDAVTLPLAPGLASVELRSGWTLERSTDGGSTYQPVSALLGSLNPAGLRVLANQPAIVQFAFLIRDPNGTLRITLGVVPDPRELAGGVVIDTATDGLAGYAQPGFNRMDFAMFFQLAKLQSVALGDGTKQHIYTAGTISGVPGPNPPVDTPLAAEFYNDNLGIMAGPIASGFAAGSLQYIVAAKPDGTFELSGEIDGATASIVFVASAIDAVSSPSLGSDGFPNDEFFYDSGVPFTLTSSLGTMSGTLRIRHVVPSP
jgi:hypothetical protein